MNIQNVKNLDHVIENFFIQKCFKIVQIFTTVGRNFENILHISLFENVHVILWEEVSSYIFLSSWLPLKPNKEHLKI